MTYRTPRTVSRLSVKPHAADSSRRTTLVLALATLTYAVSQTMVIPALPEMQRFFGSSAADTGWVMSAFFISSAVCTGIAGRLGDIFGKRRVLLFLIAAFGTGAAICALAATLPAMVVGRVIMGVGGGIVPIAYSIARDEVAGTRLSTAFGTIAMTIGLGAGVGMVAGGLFVDHAGFHWSFVAAVLLTIAVFVTVLRVVPESPFRTAARVDWGGAVLLLGGLGALLAAISRGVAWGWGSDRVLGLAAVGLAVIVALVTYERRRPQPMLHIATLVRRPVLAANIAALAMGAGQVAVSILIVQYAQVPELGGGLGATATQASLFLIPYSITMVIGARLAGGFARHRGGRPVLIGGATLAALGVGLLAFVPISPVWLCVLAGLSGLGISMTLVAPPLILAGAVDRARTAEANGANTIARNVGQSIGAQMTATVISAQVIVGSGGLPSAAGYAPAFVLSALACVGAVAAGLLVPRRLKLVTPYAAGLHGPNA